MSQIKSSHLIISALLALTLGGCGGTNDKNGKIDTSVFPVESGHPTGWVGTHKAAARADVAMCTECHGADYTGGISKVSCMSGATAGRVFSCHVTSPIANMTGCVSCHGGSVSGPFGSVAPNTRSAHTKHTSIDGIGCSTCHFNGGSGTSDHAKASASGGFSLAKVAINTLFSAKATPGYDTMTKTCSSVSCHGGKTTPVWTDSINIVAGDNALCQKCHEQGTSAGQPQYNSYYSGLHEYHLVKGLKKGTTTPINANCTDCHNISSLLDFKKHFSGVVANKIVAPQQTIGVDIPTKINTYTDSKCTTAAGCHTAVVTVPWVTPQ